MVYRFKYRTVTSGDFRDLFVEVAKSRASEITQISVDDVSAVSWWEVHLLSRGMPRHPWPDFSNSLSLAAELLANKWIAKATQLRASEDGLVSLENVSSLDIEVSA